MCTSGSCLAKTIVYSVSPFLPLVVKPSGEKVTVQLDWVAPAAKLQENARPFFFVAVMFMAMGISTVTVSLSFMM